MKTHLGQFFRLLAIATPLFAGASSMAANVTWTGAGGNALWSTGNNWSTTASPAIGDTPVFGTVGAGGATLNNDLTAGTTFFGLTFNANASAFTLNGNSIVSTNTITDNSLNTQTISLPMDFTVTNTLSVAAGGSLVVNGVISDVGGVTKTGAGAVTLTGAATGANTYTGATTINAGTLNVDFTTGGSTPAADIIANTSALAMGGGTLNVVGNVSGLSSQTFASTAFNPGNSIIKMTGTTPTLALGALTFQVGGSVRFDGPATQDAAGNPVAATGTNTTTTVGVGNHGLFRGNLYAGINPGVAAYATVGLYDWASSSLPDGSAGASPYTIIGGSQVSGFYVTTFTGGANMDMTANTTTGTGNPQCDTVRFNTPAANALTERGNFLVGGFLVTPNMVANNASILIGASGGPWQVTRNGGGTTDIQEGIIWQNNPLGYFIMNPSISDGRDANDINRIVIAGSSTVVFLNANTYRGQTYLNGGFLMITNNNGLGAPATAAAVNLSGGTLVANRSFVLDNAGVNARPVTVLGSGGGLAATAGNTLTVNGLVGSAPATGPLTIGIAASSANGNTQGLLPGSGAGTANTTPVTATGTVILNAANFYYGGTVLQSGTLNINGINALGGANYGGLTFNGGTLQYSTSLTSGSDLSTANSITIAAGGGIIDLNGQAVTYANSIGNAGSGALTLGSSVLGGALTLSAASTYTGGTTINNNTILKVNNTSGSGTGSGSVTVASGGTLGGSGIITGSINWQSGSAALFTYGAPLIAGVVTLNNNAVTINVPGGTPIPVGTYTLMTYTSAGSTGSFSTGTPTYTGAGAAPGTISTVSTSGGLVTLTVVAGGTSASWINDVNGNWSDGTKWSSNPTVPHAAGDAATLGVGSVLRTVTLDVNETVGAIAFTNANSFVISGGNVLTLDNTGAGATVTASAGTANAIQTAVSLKDNASVSVSSGQSLSISGVIGNTTTAKILTVNGAGTNILAAANTYGPASGSIGTALNGGGTLRVANNSALSTGDLSVIGTGGTLQSGAAGLSVGNNIGIGTALSVDANGNTFTLGGAISGGGTLTKTGNGTLALGGNNTYSGNTTINGGVLSVSSAANMANTPSVIMNGGDLLGSATFSAANNIKIGLALGTVGTNAFIDAASGQTFTVNGVIATSGNTGTNNLTVNSIASSPGTVVLGGANTFSGTTVIAGGTLQLTNGLALQNSTVNYSVGGTLDFGPLTAATFGGLIGTKNLSLLNNLALGGAAPVALSIGANGIATTYSGNLSGAGASLIKLGGGTTTLTGNNSYSNTTVNAGVLQVSAGSTVNTGAANVAAGARLIVNGGTLTSTLSGNIGSGGVTGLLVSSGAANFNGGLTTDLGANAGNLINVTGGSLSASSLALGRTALVFTTQPTAGDVANGLYVNGGAVNITGSINMGTVGAANSSVNARIDSGSLTVGGTLTIGLANGGRWSVVDVNGGSLTVTDIVNGIAIGGPLAGNAELLLRNGSVTAGIINVGNAVADTVALTMTNGSLYIGQGGIVKGSAATATVSLGGGLLGATTNWSSLVDITLSGTTDFTIQAADALGAAHDIALQGAISGGVGLVKTGAGTLTIGGGNTYSGITTVSNGNLIVSTAHAANTDVVLNDGKTFGVSNILASATSAKVANLTLGNSSGPTTLLFANVADPLTPVLDASAGAITLNGNNTLKIADSVNLVANNEYPLLKYTTIVTNNGTGFTLSLPPGVVATLTNDASISAIAIKVISVAATPPSISSIAASGNNLILNASGGIAGATVYVLTSTNLALPVAQWTTNSTTAYDGSGNLVNYTITGALNSGLPKQFYRLKQ